MLISDVDCDSRIFVTVDCSSLDICRAVQLLDRYGHRCRVHPDGVLADRVTWFKELEDGCA